MVITVEISGVLEEKVRRLVDLGLYMSASEVIRDALRNLMKTINLNEIATAIYETRRATIDYLSYLLEKPTPAVINMLIANEISPLLGDISDEGVELSNRNLIIDKTTLFILYSSGVAELLEEIAKLGYKFYILEELVNSYNVYSAKFIRQVRRQPVKINIYSKNIREVEYSREIPYTSPLEQKIIEIASREGFAVLSEDIRFREILKEKNISATSTIWIIKFLYDNKIIDYDNYVNYIYMLKSAYVIIPPSIEGV